MTEEAKKPGAILRTDEVGIFFKSSCCNEFLTGNETDTIRDALEKTGRFEAEGQEVECDDCGAKIAVPRLLIKLGKGA